MLKEAIGENVGMDKAQVRCCEGKFGPEGGGLWNFRIEVGKFGEEICSEGRVVFREAVPHIQVL